ncbi:MAG: site-specific DNA-methyltransferase, partial [Methanophagales archaeon]|nr:site-specific DNA-methyltransferase [Methanophagales archaeon]
MILRIYESLFFRHLHKLKRSRKILCRSPAVFPKFIVRGLIKLTTDEGDIVLDPFVGSGTVAVAAKKLKRRFIGFEINPEYCKYA